jgi:glycosyltransferase involved in cell wall biosynthesis
VKVALDATALLPQPTGVDNHLLGVVRSLAAHDRETEYTLFINVEDADRFAGLPPNFIVRRLSIRPRVVRLAFQQAVLPAAARAGDFDVVHSPAFIAPLVHGRRRHVLTVHDMTSFSHPECHNRLRRSAAYRKLVLTSIRGADVVVAPSRSAALEIERFVPDLPADRVRVIPAGIGPEFAPQTVEQARPVLKRLGIESPFVLFVGTMEPRKGLSTLVAAYRRLVATSPDVPPLVLVGARGWGVQEMLVHASRNGLRDHLHLLGYVSASDLSVLYSSAKVCVYPSLAEGFGFPPLEAMASGTPVIASDSTSLRENLAGAAVLVPPEQPEALAHAFERLLRDDARRRELTALGFDRAAAFTWDETARLHLGLYRELAAS